MRSAPPDADAVDVAAAPFDESDPLLSEDEQASAVPSAARAKKLTRFTKTPGRVDVVRTPERSPGDAPVAVTSCNGHVTPTIPVRDTDRSRAVTQSLRSVPPGFTRFEKIPRAHHTRSPANDVSIRHPRH